MFCDPLETRPELSIKPTYYYRRTVDVMTEHWRLALLHRCVLWAVSMHGQGVDREFGCQAAR